MGYKKNKSNGFTIIELLIVLVVIGILATLVIVTFTGVQQKTSDNKRQKNLITIQATLDSYYSSNNTYPTVSHLNNPRWLAENIPSFNVSLLKDPRGTQPTVIAGDTPTRASYSYSVSPTDCSDDLNKNNPCTNYGIYALLEANNTIVSKVSNN